MKINATDFEDFFKNSGIYQQEIRKFDDFMKNTVSAKRQLFSGNSITMIGYGEVSFKTKSSKGVFPVIAVAPQKVGISIYIAAKYKNQELAQYFKGKLGKAQYGKKTVRFKKFDQLDKDKLAEMIELAFEWQNENENTYGRNCAKPIK